MNTCFNYQKPNSRTRASLGNLAPNACETSPDCEGPASVSNIEDVIAEQKRLVAAARASAAVRDQMLFARLALPSFDVTAINSLLCETLSELDAGIVAHLRGLGSQGEAWVGEGVGYVPTISARSGHDACPFCTQDLSASALLAGYRLFFGGAYQALKDRIGSFGKQLGSTHSDGVRTGLERALSAEEQHAQFWRDFVPVPAVDLDISTFIGVWRRASEAVLTVLREKWRAPLQLLTLLPEAMSLVAEYEARRLALLANLDALQLCNEEISRVKAQTASAELKALEAELNRLQATRSRHSQPLVASCGAYLEELAAKEATSRLKTPSLTT